MYVRRTIEQTLRKLAESFPCLVLYGPRQVGKSTTIDMLFGDDFKKVTLDDRDDRLLAENNPKLFLETWQWPVIIDEIQKAPVLLEEIKKRIDHQRLRWLKNGEERQLMYVLTGSNRFELQEGIAESLAGRCGVLEMSSFSNAEKHGIDGVVFVPEIDCLRFFENQGRTYQTKTEIFDAIFEGGMPDICTGISERTAYFKSYVNTYIERDVMKLIAASSESQFRDFIGMMALRTAQELHYDEIAGQIGIDVRTCKRWISILQTSGIIVLLQPYMARMSKRIIKAPKFYFMDTGLCAYLCKWPNAKMLESCAMSGAFFETWVVSEIIKNLQAFNINISEELYYYRDIDGKEIDLIFEREGVIIPVEIKKNRAPVKPTKNFDVLKKYQKPIGTGVIIDTCDKIRPINEKAFSFPAYLL